MELLAYLATIGLVLGVAQGCCLPLQWEATVGLVEGYADSTGSKRGSVSGVEVLHFDAMKRKIAAEADIYNNGVHISTKVIQDYTNKIQYMIQNNTCRTQPLGEFPNRCFDTSSAFRYYSGGPKVNIPVQSVVVQKEKTHYSISLTADNSNTCFFVGVLQSGEANGVGYMLTEGFMNTTTGIKDPSVFNVPTYCHHKRMLMSKDAFHFQRSALNIFRL